MQQFPFHRQKTKYTCGSAATRMTLEACGIRRSEKQVAKMLGTNKVRGTWAASYPKVFERFRLNYTVMRNADIADMRRLMKKNYIILTSYYYPREKVDHFVVIRDITKTHIHFWDPWFGPDHKYTLTYFQRIWRTDPRYDDERGWFIAVKKPDSK